MKTSAPNLSQAVKIDDGSHASYNWTIAGGVTYNDVINYERSGKKQTRHCVMCGDIEDGRNSKIPNQNKDVCRVCDSTYWFLDKKKVLVKFCKGCKTFFPLMNYDDKPEASKCGSCRRRGRDNYYFKKEKDAAQGNSAAAVGVSVIDKEKDEHKYVQSMKKMRANTMSPEEFCTLVNSMTTKEDEGIDVHTLLEYASNDHFSCEMDVSSHSCEPSFMISNENSLMMDDDGYDDEFAQIWDNDKDDDDDEMMNDMFMWLPELIISPPLSPTCSVCSV
mmetsp:Transcript_16651/g.31204  ORF Transcript_16651/g.31204 Transcript_16651/m.31204 type:complete len:276 (-) Transcript_16651:2800-3627(-)